MLGKVRPPFTHLAPLDRVRLRRVAIRYAAHGWPVTPGACLTRHRFVCGRAGCPTTGCHPACADWEQSASTDPVRVASWWRDRPHTVLLPTGLAFDVVEVPAYLGRHVLHAARARSGPARSGAPRGTGPVAVTPNGRWMFLVRPGDPLRPELEHCLYILRHGVGSWMPAPPTRLPEGVVRWVVSPEETRWRLPDSYVVQQLLADALRTLHRAPSAGAPTTRLPSPRRGC